MIPTSIEARFGGCHRCAMRKAISACNGATGPVLAVAIVLSLCACATPPAEPKALAEFERINDPLEPLNRDILDFNFFADRTVIKPAAQAYEAVVPEKGRDAVRHFLDNLNEPIVFANTLLQGQFKRAHDTFARFLMNSMFGLGGTLDLATSTGLEKQTGDFGQTLYTWGVRDGPYVMLPILGPSTVRDSVGRGVDIYADPFGQLAGIYHESVANYGRYLVNGIDVRQRDRVLDELQKNALDPYAELRSLFRQHRAQELRDGEPVPPPDLEPGD